MKTRSLLPVLALALSAPLLAQDAPPAQVADRDVPPAQLAAHELDRSRRCVSGVALLARVDAELEPFFRQLQRIQALTDAIALEDTTRVAPFDLADPLEVAVRDWFAADMALALRYLSDGGDSILARRAEAQDAIRQRLRDALEPLRDEVEARIDSMDDIDAAADECQDVVLVRSAVLEACQSVESPVCEEARSQTPMGRFAFVDAPEDLWDLEQLRPWSDPARLHRTPDGGLGGARTAAGSRRGNLMLAVGLEPLIQPRSTLDPEDVADFDANLDSLGFTFEDSRFVMAPALTIDLNLTQPLGGETHYLLHFGDLSDPLNDIVWTGRPAPGEPVRAIFPAPGWVLAAMATGDTLKFTALHVIQEGVEARAVFVLDVPPFGQNRAVAGLLSYMASQLGQDLTALVPPGDGGP